MEQNMQFLMWMKSKQLVMNSHSWEEQAFAEDAAGPLGAFVWPPRSYSCTFCRREFRSAQALGGHMNVHRRDRARLKQSLCNEENHQDQDLDEGNHNINSPPISSSSPSRDSNTASRASNNGVISPGRVSNNILREQQRLRFPYSRNIHLHDDDGDEVETTLSVGITGSNSKRLKSSASFPFYQKYSCSSDHHHHHQRFPFQYSSTTDDVVDLELRLGDSPAVK